MAIAPGATNLPTTGVQPFDPEFTTNYERAYRYQTVDGSLTFNANGFYTRWTDQQVIVGPTSATQFTANGGESETYGLEADVSWLPNANLNLYASAAYVKTEYLDFVNAGVDLSGNESPAAPPLPPPTEAPTFGITTSTWGATLPILAVRLQILKTL